MVKAAEKPTFGVSIWILCLASPRFVRLFVAKLSFRRELIALGDRHVITSHESKFRLEYRIQ
jgi:hypothetical protein